MGHYDPIFLRLPSGDEDTRQYTQGQWSEDATTKVLLAISLRADTLLVLDEWTQWLSSFHPPQVAGVEVKDAIKVPLNMKAAFPSGSTLLLLSMPVTI